MYLRKMGSVSLLTREGEVEIAKRIEDGEKEVLRALLEQEQERLNIFRASSRLPGFARQLSLALRELQERDIWVVGAAGEAESDLNTFKHAGALAWVLGAEGEGLRRLTKETCDQLVRIPMLGSVESLNVSVSAGVCLYEARRQRKGKA